ncbi:V-type ATP synthase subunit D [Marinibacterium profundimaris]|uniref:ATP synthase subunit D n=1 Tax=Marinibacterium profundimaris TaxID=1679460 RepID=A0A225NPE3_9RHOB|nr:V-type ATP synthase subunit D [Marinibacterium profundimaris]OWU76129.1 ATP synthase subunit D [Marinibacterium profundimaris]
MARLQLNKSALARESAQLKTYERFLPSLDLKRQQLMATRAQARAEAAALQARVDDVARRVGREVPMLANDDIDLDGLVKLGEVTVTTENVVGVMLPRLDRVEVIVHPYSPLAKPQWVDTVAALLRETLELRLRLQVAQRRLAELDAAVATITQRVNLFDKVLIPNARANIRRIRVYLSDEEMQAVVRSKISKRKRAAT